MDILRTQCLFFYSFIDDNNIRAYIIYEMLSIHRLQVLQRTAEQHVIQIFRSHDIVSL